MMKGVKFLPEILPADPTAPEGYNHAQQSLRYGIIGRLLGWLGDMQDKRELRRMDDRILRDIGMTRDDVTAQARGLNWETPAFWKTADHAGRANRTLDAVLSSPRAV